MTVEHDLEILVTPLLERELTASPTMHEIEQWRRRAEITADPSTVLGALLSRFDGLSVEHNQVRATIRWFGSSVVAGEKSLLVLMELSTADARAAVLELDRGHDRVFGVPVAKDATARIDDVLRQTIEQHSVDGRLPEAHFFGTVAEFLRNLPGRLVAPTPAESLGSWVIEHGISELLGEACEVPLARGQRLSVHVRNHGASLQAAKDGIWFAPLVEIRRTGAKGKLLDETEQQMSVGFLGTDAMFEPVPDADHCRVALEVLRRWKTELARRIARLPSAQVRSLMPMDLPWPTSPLALAVQALRHGPPGCRTSAGELGPLARETATTLRELDGAEIAPLDVPGVLRAYRVGAYTLLLRRREDDDENVEESLWVRRDAGEMVPVVFWLEESREAFSADGDEPAYRLFAQWMRSALAAGGHDRELPSGVLPSEWMFLQDRDGEPLDHRVVEGMVSARGYTELEDLPSAAEAADSANMAKEIFRALVRELIDPNARFGQRVAELGLP